jgi:hypothetical protein
MRSVQNWRRTAQQASRMLLLPLATSSMQQPSRMSWPIEGDVYPCDGWSDGPLLPWCQQNSSQAPESAYLLERHSRTELCLRAVIGGMLSAKSCETALPECGKQTYSWIVTSKRVPGLLGIFARYRWSFGTFRLAPAVKYHVGPDRIFALFLVVVEVARNFQ